jgi:NAD(P)-dependent dehydrogenase (short-subunit alcohol dehydrogenase family)
MSHPIGQQVMVVTGASSGIGLATARAAARLGAKVALAARNARDLDRAVDEIVRAGAHAIAVPTDVTDLQQVEGLAEAVVERWGRIDTWVNNAAVSAYATFREQPIEDFRRLLEVNFMGQVHGARAALPHLERSDGALICVGSALSDRGVPLLGAYSASKHALKGWLDSLRTELEHEGSGVRVTLVKPSSINTPFFNKAKTQLGVMPRPIPPVYDVQLAVDAILRAAEGNVRDVYVGGAGKALAIAERISPKLVDIHQLRNGLENQHTDWPKDANAPHNLYEPLEHDGGGRPETSCAGCIGAASRSPWPRTRDSHRAQAPRSSRPARPRSMPGGSAGPSRRSSEPEQSRSSARRRSSWRLPFCTGTDNDRPTPDGKPFRRRQRRRSSLLDRLGEPRPPSRRRSKLGAATFQYRK